MYHLNGVLSMLGLALRGGRLAVGEEPVEIAAQRRDARLLLLASNAAANTLRRTKLLAELGQCIWLQLPFSKEELGPALGRASAAVVAVTDLGLARAIVHRLADIDPVSYGEAAARLDVKAKRAAERKRRPPAPKAPPRAKQQREPGYTEPPQKAADSHRGSSHPPQSGHPQRKNKPGGAYHPYAHSRPVKKGKGSFRKKNEPF